MILSVTLHTSVDQAQWSSCFEVTRLRNDFIGERVAGKGVNLARVLAALGCPVRALGMVGHQERARFESELAAQGISSAWVEVDGPTRRNLTTIDYSLGMESHDRRPGYTIGPEHLDAMARLLEAEVAAGDVVVFAGSLPQGMEIEDALDLARICQRRGAEIVLDSAGDVLRPWLSLEPVLIAPNHIELFVLIRQTRYDPLEIARLAAELLPQVREVLVTMGDQGAVLVCAQGAWHARVHVDKPVCTVGCGDAFLAGFLDARRQQRTPQDCLAAGVASGSAAVLQALAGDIEPSDVRAALQRVEFMDLW